MLELDFRIGSFHWEILEELPIFHVEKKRRYLFDVKKNSGSGGKTYPHPH